MRKKKDPNTTNALPVDPKPTKDFPNPQPPTNSFPEKYLVLGGYARRDINGNWPHITAYRLMQELKLPAEDCLLADERDTMRIAFLKQQHGPMRIVTVDALRPASSQP